MRDVRDQAERISRCRMSFQITQGSRAGLVNQLILDTAMFVDDGEKKGSMFIETATLSQTFFDQLKKHPVPIEEAAVRQLANNSMALDVYPALFMLSLRKRVLRVFGLAGGYGLPAVGRQSLW